MSFLYHAISPWAPGVYGWDEGRSKYKFSSISGGYGSTGGEHSRRFVVMLVWMVEVIAHSQSIPHLRRRANDTRDLGWALGAIPGLKWAFIPCPMLN